MADGVSTRNRSGLWVPAIPEPLYGRGFFRWKIRCGEQMCDLHPPFRSHEEYRGHYALVHVMELS